MLDYKLLDELFHFLDQDSSEILPILCGYFNKIVTALLSKIKQKMLVYLLIERNGDVFDRLLGNLEHHSLAQMMIELMQIRIVSASAATRDRFSSDFDKEDNTEDGESQAEDEKQKELDRMSPQERQMMETLNNKKQMVVQTLMERLSSKNSNFEQCLNAHTILAELADNETTFAKLAQRDNMLLLIKASTDTKNLWQAYALNILTTIIKEFPDYEKQIGKNLSLEFQGAIGNSFLDITYGAIMTIRGPSEVTAYNQSGVAV